MTGRTINNRTSYFDILGQHRKIGSVKSIPSAMTKGSIDISATIQGKSVKIKIKWGNDRQSPILQKYQSENEKAGGIYLIIQTFDKFYDWDTATFLQNDIYFRGSMP